MPTCTIKTLKNKTYEYNFEEDSKETVGEFKDRIYETLKSDDEKMEREILRLIKGGKMLPDSDPIINYHGGFIIAVSTKISAEQSNTTNKTTNKTTNTTTNTTTNNNQRSSSSGNAPNPSIIPINTNNANVNPFTDLFSDNSMTISRIPIKYFQHQNDFHAANALAEVFNDNSQLTNLIRNTNYFRNLSQAEQTNLVDDMENNAMAQNLNDITKFLIEDYQNFSPIMNQEPSTRNTSNNNNPFNNNNNLGLIQFLQTLGASNIIPIGLGGYNQVSEEQRTTDINEIKIIVGASFTDSEIERAYAICGNDVNSAINYLLNPEDD